MQMKLRVIHHHQCCCWWRLKACCSAITWCCLYLIHSRWMFSLNCCKELNDPVWLLLGMWQRLPKSASVGIADFWCKISRMQICLVIKIMHIIVTAIHFKIATLTYCTLQSTSPSYLTSLINFNNPPRFLCSSSLNLLHVPFTAKAIGRNAFRFTAPTVWNSIPQNIRLLPSIGSFKCSLKTHPFSIS